MCRQHCWSGDKQVLLFLFPHVYVHLHNVHIVSRWLQDPDDLPFEKGEILSLIRKDEEQWWTACNSRGQKGLVPVPYIERVLHGIFSIYFQHGVCSVVQADCHDSNCVYSPTFLCVHCEVEKRNHFLMNNSFNTQCNLTKFSAFIVNECYHRCYWFNFWNLHQFAHLSGVT